MLSDVRGAAPGAGGVQAADRLIQVLLAGADIQREQGLLQGSFVEHDDEAGHPVADRDQLEASDPGGPGLGRRRDPGRVGRRGERRGGQPEPLVRGELHLPELVADHELLDGRERDIARQALDVEAVAGIRRNAARRRVRVGQEALRLQLREDGPYRGGADLELIALHERLRSDRCRAGDVFLDDGAQDRLGSLIQRAGAASNSSGHRCVAPAGTLTTGVPNPVSTLIGRVPTT